MTIGRLHVTIGRLHVTIGRLHVTTPPHATMRRCNMGLHDMLLDVNYKITCNRCIKTGRIHTLLTTWTAIYNCAKCMSVVT